MRAAALLISVLLTAVGCRTSPQAEREIALLRAEILDLEDQYYALKSQRDSAVTRLRDCEGSDFDAGRYPDPTANFGCVDCGNEVIYSDSGIEYYEPDSHFDSAPSQNFQDTGSGADGDLPESILENESPLEEIEPDLTLYAVPQSESMAGGKAADRLRIDPQLSTAENFDGQPGDDGITLFLQPVTASGEFVPAARQTGVQIFERSGNSSRRLIGSWDFSPQEMESFRVRKDHDPQGILLHLPWGDALPRSRRIEVVATMPTRNGRLMRARLPLGINPPPRNYSADDPAVVAWIEQDPRWIDSADGTDPMIAEYDFDEPDSLDSELEIQSARSTDSEVPRWRPVR